MNRSSVRSTMFLLTALCVCCALSAAQSSSKKPSKSGSSSSPGSTAQANTAGTDQSANGPFSIETEMFTYKAVEENGQIIACDIARYLYQGEVTTAPPGSHAPCAISNSGQTIPGIVLVSSDSTLLADFQLWRSDMASMSALEARADKVCVAPPETKSESGQPGTSPGSGLKARGLGVADLTAPGQAASALGTVMQLFNKSEAVTSVVGTVENPALLNEVARQLRSLNVMVLVPELYNPNSLGAVDNANSPYLQNLNSLYASYDKCEAAKAAFSKSGDSGAAAKDTADIDSVIASMDAFLKTTLGSSGPTSTANSPDAPAGSQTAPENTPSHLASALSADEVAKQIGFTGNGSTGPSPTWQHVLWLKALESGGSVNHKSSIFGTKVTFGGGAVDTYAVFRVNGQLVCSGNVYNFQPPVGTKELEKAFHAPPADDPAKPFMLHSTCALLP